MHEDCEFCVKRNICTRDVPKPCSYRYTEDERKADQASDQCGVILSAMYLPKTYQKEDNKMKATSVQKIENVKDISFVIENNPIEGKHTLSIVACTNDDIFEFYFEGPELIQQCKAAGLFDGWEKSQKIRELEEINKNLKKHVQYHIDDKGNIIKRNDELKEKNRMLEKENEKLKDKVEHVEPFRALERTIREKHQLQEENEKLKKQLNAVTLILDNFRKDHEDILKTQREKHKDEVEQLNQLLTLYEKRTDVLLKEKEKFREVNEKLKRLKTPTIENFADEEPSTRADILDQAKKCVCGQREQDYGTPESNFQLIADLWNDYLGNNLSKEKRDFEKKLGIARKELSVPWEISAMDVSMMMALLKIARIRNGGGSGDSFVDLAGYAACGGEIWADKRYQKDQN